MGGPGAALVRRAREHGVRALQDAAGAAEELTRELRVLADPRRVILDRGERLVLDVGGPAALAPLPRQRVPAPPERRERGAEHPPHELGPPGRWEPLGVGENPDEAARFGVVRDQRSGHEQRLCGDVEERAGPLVGPPQPPFGEGTSRVVAEQLVAVEEELGRAGGESSRDRIRDGGRIAPQLGPGVERRSPRSAQHRLPVDGGVVIGRPRGRARRREQILRRAGEGRGQRGPPPGVDDSPRERPDPVRGAPVGEAAQQPERDLEGETSRSAHERSREPPGDLLFGVGLQSVRQGVPAAAIARRSRILLEVLEKPERDLFVVGRLPDHALDHPAHRSPRQQREPDPAQIRPGGRRPDLAVEHSVGRELLVAEERHPRQEGQDAVAPRGEALHARERRDRAHARQESAVVGDGRRGERGLLREVQVLALQVGLQRLQGRGVDVARQERRVGKLASSGVERETRLASEGLELARRFVELLVDHRHVGDSLVQRVGHPRGAPARSSGRDEAKQECHHRQSRAFHARSLAPVTHCD